MTLTLNLLAAVAWIVLAVELLIRGQRVEPEPVVKPVSLAILAGPAADCQYPIGEDWVRWSKELGGDNYLDWYATWEAVEASWRWAVVELEIIYGRLDAEDQDTAVLGHAPEPEFASVT